VVESAARLLDDFETEGGWTVRTTAGTPGTLSFTDGAARRGKRVLRLEYDLGAAGGTRAVYAQTAKPLGRPLALRLWVRGDGQGAWLRVRLRDAKNATHLVDLARKVDWSDWREVRAAVPEGLAAPVTLDALYVVATDEETRPKGALLIDDLSVEP
jgi:hypothetical protein